MCQRHRQRCNCPTTTGPCPVYCIQVHEQGTSTGVAGLTATIHGTLSGSPWSVSGTTDATGQWCYTLPTTGAIPVPSYGVASDPAGCQCGAMFGGSCTVAFVRCKATVAIAITDAAAPTIGVEIDRGYWIETRTSGTSTWTLCYLAQYGTYPSPEIVTFGTNATAPGLWPEMCATVTVACGGSYSIDLTQVDLSSCYFNTGNPSCLGSLTLYSCNGGSSYGKGPNYRGVIPKKLQAKFTSNDPSISFGTDGGVWIDLTGSPILNSFGTVTGYTWDSGCRGPHGNACGGAGYGSTRVVFNQSSLYYAGGNFSYTRYGGHSCDSPAQCKDPYGNDLHPGPCDCNVDSVSGDICSPCDTSVDAGVGCLLTAPVDFLLGRDKNTSPFYFAVSSPIPVNWSWYAEIRETC